MGGAACKEAIDGTNANGMAAQLEVTLSGYATVLPHLMEYLNTAEKKRVAVFSEKADKVLDSIADMAQRVREFYEPLAQQYGVTIAWPETDNPIGRFRQTLEAVNAVIFDLSEKLTPAEQKKALRLSYDECEFAEKVGKFNDAITKWYTDTAKKYAKT